MSYIVETTTKESFLENLPKSQKSLVTTALNQFGVFTTDVYQKKSETVLTDVVKISKEDHNNEKIHTLLNQYVQWLMVAHPGWFCVYWS